jgi:hypothetical protein
LIFFIFNNVLISESWAGNSTLSDNSQSQKINNTPSLVLNLKHDKISVQLGNIILREYTITALSDSDSVHDVAAKYNLNQTSDLTIREVHLISTAEKLSKVEMDIISEETHTTSEKIQRYIPAKMVLEVSDGLNIYIEAECPNAQTFRREQVKDFFRRIWNKLSWNSSIHIRLSSDDAMSLYGISISEPIIIINP